MHYYEVAPHRLIRAQSSVFTYASEQELSRGMIVKIPLGKTLCLAVVMRAVSKPTFETKQITEIYDITPLPGALLDTATWMCGYYGTHLSLGIGLLLPKGLDIKRRVDATSPKQIIQNRTTILLNTDQQSAIDTILAAKGSFLLEGVTGSGKTNVYLSLADKALSEQKSVVVLVPEIALTSQIIASFREHFPEVELLHSELTEKERFTTWMRIAANPLPQVIIGPRSALFAPIQNIGLIIVDESHESSYKQDQSPKYSALRVASTLGNKHGARVIYGSATPSISEKFLALQNPDRIIYLNNKARAKTKKPHVSLIDMTKKDSRKRHPFLSEKLLGSIESQLASGNQILLYHNRRGSATVALCEECGWSALCINCHIPLTLHGDTHILLCHICGQKEKVPKMCPTCQSSNILFKGFGTKRIEADIRKLFPSATVARFDGDTKKPDTLHALYPKLVSGEINILIGTQVVAKGLDLPRLGLVGVLQADSGLGLPDYIAEERTFQLLAQVIGRVGRDDRTTEVVVQSYQPQAASVQYGITQDYTQMYEHTIAERRRQNFPPFVFLLKLTTSHKTEKGAVLSARTLVRKIRDDFPTVQVLGPTPSLYERSGGSYHWQILVKSKKRQTLQDIAMIVPKQNWQFDLDPASLL